MSRSLLPVADPARRRFCLSIVNLRSSLFVRNVLARLRLHLSDFVDLFHLLGSFICGFVDVLWVFVLWICGSVLWVCRFSLWVVDLLILFFRNQTCV